VVRIDPLQFEQVLVNLAINARDAMPNGGALEVSVDQSLLAEDEARRCSLQPGAFCRVRVRDSGIGMPPGVAERIFEPFFTTKPLGSGTGLGLSTVHGIVHQSNGAITVDSTEGAGTEFTLYFPLTHSEQSFPAVVGDAMESPGGSETLLLAEDGQQVRSVTQRQLERAGYRVLVAADGEEALNVARTYDGPIHLLVSDVMMPRMNGPELASKLEALHPKIKVVFMSGYTERMMMQRTKLSRELVRLHKPFSMNELLTSVRERLDGD
jgi:CheY-like chemotaxis protein